jgi:hypothetical protein
LDKSSGEMGGDELTGGATCKADDDSDIIMMEDLESLIVFVSFCLSLLRLLGIEISRAPYDVADIS